MTARTLVLHPHLKHKKIVRGRTPQACLEEAVGLSHAISLDIVDSQVIALSEVRPSSLLGTGTMERIAEQIQAVEIELVVMDCHLSPVQQRNLEKSLKAKVIDRTALILEIFGERAQTREGKLQVELAALEYQKSRLVRSWTHLERQRGGFGFTGGPGESQIELDRRIIRDRIIKIKGELETVVRTRNLHRKTRREIPYPLVALVGYTNAGKSTLFNRLTRADTLEADALFATLDPTIRRCDLAGGNPIMLPDTVGFISDLPTQLVAAFRATLEEVCEADVLLHVRDGSHPDTRAQKHDVLHVLKDLMGEHASVPIIEVLNKCDKLEQADFSADESEDVLRISAITGEGLPALTLRIREVLSQKMLEEARYSLPSTAGKELAWLYAHTDILSSTPSEDGTLIEVHARFTPANHARFVKMLRPLGVASQRVVQEDDDA